jgi:hypothetical protein
MGFLLRLINLPVYSCTLFCLVPLIALQRAFLLGSTSTPSVLAFKRSRLYLLKINQTISIWSTFIGLVKGVLELEDIITTLRVCVCVSACVCVQEDECMCVQRDIETCMCSDNLFGH